MRTLYLRNVPDDTVARLERLAKRDGMSANAFVVRELSEASRRVDDAALLAMLPDLDVPKEEILRAIAEGRAER